jgi:nitric oxide reductase activation protein
LSAACFPAASNRDGCAVRHAAAKLVSLPHKTKLLLLLSDGIPADVDYGSASNTGQMNTNEER